MRAFDAMQALRYLRSLDDVSPAPMRILAEDDMSIVGLLASIADGHVYNHVFRGLPASYRNAINDGYYDRRQINEWTSIHGMLNHFDISDLLAALPKAHEHTPVIAK